jgi:class 3 adenylate cyclase
MDRIYAPRLPRSVDRTPPRGGSARTTARHRQGGRLSAAAARRSLVGMQRKVVTALFCDVVGSTALGESVDPEALQAVLACYFERMRAIVESHGGTVEKFIGDAVMAVF